MLILALWAVFLQKIQIINVLILSEDAKIFTNQCLCIYHRQMWPTCKLLWNNYLAHSFQTSKGTVQITHNPCYIHNYIKAMSYFMDFLTESLVSTVPNFHTIKWVLRMLIIILMIRIIKLDFTSGKFLRTGKCNDLHIYFAKDCLIPWSVLFQEVQIKVENFKLFREHPGKFWIQVFELPTRFDERRHVIYIHCLIDFFEKILGNITIGKKRYL